MSKQLSIVPVITFAETLMREKRIHLRPLHHTGQDLKLEWQPGDGTFVIVDRGQEQSFDSLEAAAQVYVDKYNNPKLQNKRPKRSRQRTGTKSQLKGSLTI